MKRLAKHPVIRKDAMFRSFIQDKEVSKTLKPIATFKTAINTFKSRIQLVPESPFINKKGIKKQSH